MSRIHSWTSGLARRFAEDEFDGIAAFALMGLVAGGLVAISILLEAQ